MSARVAPEQANQRPLEPSRTRAIAVMLGTLVIVVVAGWLADARWSQITGIFTDGWRYFLLMAEGLLHSPFSEPWSGYWSLSISRMLESVYMAWIGTLIGAVLSVPFGFLAARNVSGRVTVQVTRAFLNLVRAIPELVFAIVLLLPIVGFGPLSGALALGIGAIGTLGKLTAEALEGIDPGPVEAAQASGAPRIAILRWAHWSQVLPEVLAFWLYRFEINVRASAILGVIGAGGIGSLLSQLFGRREWDQIGIALIVIILVTMLVDAISGAIRHRIIGGGKARRDRVRDDAVEVGL